MNKFYLTLFALLFPLAVWAGGKKPNILFMMSDDHASEAIGAYGSWLKDFVHTPTIDRLAAEGMRFTNVCCNNSICSPSRASIISGQYSHVTGALNLNCRLKELSDRMKVEHDRRDAQYPVNRETKEPELPLWR